MEKSIFIQFYTNLYFIQSDCNRVRCLLLVILYAAVQYLWIAFRLKDNDVNTN